MGSVNGMTTRNVCHVFIMWQTFFVVCKIKYKALRLYSKENKQVLPMNVILPKEVRPSERTLYIIRQIAYKYYCRASRGKASKIFN